ADWRLATDRSVFGHPGSDLGLITGFGGTQRLSRLIGERAALSLLMSAERVSARQAYRYGLVQEVCGQDEFETRLKETIQRFASFPEADVVEIKRRFLDLGYP
ncbi:enoyl-CoA hydratase/isomerase family protein, partial [bacterium]